MEQKPDTLSKITVYSKFMKIVLLILMITLPCLILGMWLFLDFLPDASIRKMANVQEYSIGWNTKIFGMLSSIPSAIVTFALFFTGYRLFDLYQQGQILLSENVKCFRRIGIFLMADVVIRFIMRPVNSMIISMNNPPGHRFIHLGIGTEELITFGSAVFIMIVGWVMDEARKADEEMKLTV